MKWVWLLMVSLLAGCSESSDAPPEVADEAASPLGNETQNAPPVMSLSVDVGNGTIPFPVNFTIEATDADGDALSWTLDVNGTRFNGTELPATVLHTFNATGNTTVVATVTDGNATVSETVRVVATDEAVVVRPRGVLAEYTFTDLLPVAGTSGSHAFAVPVDADWLEVIYTSEHVGLFSAVATITDPTGAEKLYSLDECGVEFTPGAVTDTCVMVLEEPLLAGDWTATVNYQAGQVTEEYTLDITVQGFLA